jgi:hypothetical protein
MKAYPQRHKLPCGHHVHGRHGHSSPLKNHWQFSKFRKLYRTLTLTLKICILQENGFKLWRTHIGLVWKLGLRATYSVLQHFWTDHLLEHSKAMNEPQKTLKWPWKIKVLSTSLKFCLCASLKRCVLQILGMLKNASEVTLVPRNVFSNFS